MSPLRRIAAILLLLAAFAPLVVLHLHAGSGGGGTFGGGDIGGQVSYEYGGIGPATHAAATILALVIAGGAAALWAARTRALLAAGTASALVALAITPAVAPAQPHAVSPRVDRLIRNGMTEAQVRALAGAPATVATGFTSAGVQLRCFVYRNPTDVSEHSYCFQHGRLNGRSST